MSRLLRTIFVFFVAFATLDTLPVSADTIEGTFDCTGITYQGDSSFDPFSGTATFSYDTVQNLGTLSNFYPGFSQFYVWTQVYINGQLANFPNQSNAGSITTFEALTDFSAQTSQQPGIGSGTITRTLTNVWTFTGVNGQNQGSLGATGWGGNDGSSFNPKVFSGTISNFQVKPVPEPSIFCELSIGLLFFVLAGQKLRKRPA